MQINIEDLITRITELTNEVNTILGISDKAELRREYLKWYSQAQLLVSKYLPGMEEEFKDLFYSPGEQSSQTDAWFYHGIRSYLRTTSQWKDYENQFRGRFHADIEQQRGILLSIPDTLNIRAMDIAALVTSDLVDGELNESRLLLSHGFVRAAGAVAGVALESHLKLLHEQSKTEYSKTDTIVTLATNLRQANVITLGDEKKCIAMADIRNLCDHKKKRDPNEDEVEELIEDVDKFVKRVQVI